MLKRVRASDPGDVLLETACENARALSKLCDVIQAGPARATHVHELGSGDELLVHTHPDHEAPDGAWILPEEF